MNTLEPASTDTEQLETEQRDTKTAPQEPRPVSIHITPPSPDAESAVDVTTVNPEPDTTFSVAVSHQISSDLAYSCLLIPRFSDHYLTGDVTNDLATWMKEICISYGWRLDAITIRPGYLQWIMTVPLTANPAQFIRIIRQQTSQRIFEDYPRFRRKNLSNDFWAPGFSVVHGNVPQSMENINSFTLETRKQQGIF